ncbi:MAG: hypothetical protein ACXVJB_11110 [Mucilaginibacter sp.]
MRRILLLFIIAGLLSCSYHKSGWKTLKIGDYLIDVPENFKLTFEKGYDSAPGKIIGNGIDLFFDYGMFTDTLNQTVQEYLKLGRWRDYAAIRFMPHGIPYDNNYTHIKTISIRPSEKKDSSLDKGCDCVANCRFKTYHFILPITIPPDVKNYNVKIDTISNQLRRLVQSKNATHGSIGIYMGDKRRKILSSDSYNTIVISAVNLNVAQRRLVLEMFSTLRTQK